MALNHYYYQLAFLSSHYPVFAQGSPTVSGEVDAFSSLPNLLPAAARCSCRCPHPLCFWGTQTTNLPPKTKPKPRKSLRCRSRIYGNPRSAGAIILRSRR